MSETSVIPTGFPSILHSMEDRASTIADSSPYALHNLFPAGTVSFCLKVGMQVPSEAILAQDGWFNLLPYELSTLVVDNLYIEALRFLNDQHFIRTTYRSNPECTQLISRIYLIPYDLSNVCGRLRQRSSVILSQARSYMQLLYTRLVVDPQSWDSASDVNAKIRGGIFEGKADNRTMAEIYSSLPSPSLQIPYSQHPDAAATLESMLDSGYLPGLRSRLHRYQRRTVIAMAQREAQASAIPDPLYLPITALNGKTYYYQPASMEILQERPQLMTCRGGILCEELGTGKTVMALTLILATISELPDPEETLRGKPTVLTPLSSPVTATIPRRTNSYPQNHAFNSRLPPSLSLVEHMIDFVRRNPTSLRWPDYEIQLKQRGLWSPLKYNTPFYFREWESSSTDATRRGSALHREKLYLTSATLILVPPSLLGQWQSEIRKHCDSDFRALIVREKTILPKLHSLASDYDVVLMSTLRFSKEANLNTSVRFPAERPCHCPRCPTARVPECKCAPPSGCSVLWRLHWKRLLLDEGHNVANSQTNFVNFTSKLVCERRWIITGTPTTNLLGLNLGQGVECLDRSEEYPQSQYSEDSDITTLNAEPELQQYSVADSVASSADDDTESSIRIWTRQDREDLNKLSTMISVFLKFPRFMVDGKAFRTLVLDGLFNPHGPRPGSIQVLTNFLSTIMIRHRIEDVERDVVIPPMTHETILMDLDPCARMTYNVHQSLIATNIVDSERVDQDYLFHPRHAARLALTIQNISLALFWRVDDEEFDIGLDLFLKHALNALANARKRQQAEEDIQLIQKAIEHLRYAVENTVWRQMQHSLEVPFRLSNIPGDIRDGWSRFTVVASDSDSDYFLPPARAIRLREIVFRQPLISQVRLLEHAQMTKEAERVQAIFFLAKTQRLKKSGKSKFNEDGQRGALADEVQKLAESPEKFNEILNEYKKAEERLTHETEGDNEDDLFNNVTESAPVQGSRLLRQSLLADVKIGNSVSSKLNYILNEVLQHSATEKFLIFSNQPLILAHVAEGLELCRVKFLQLGHGSDARNREQKVTTFETSDLFRVLLMGLKHGARGLNIVSASRVLFCEPVWQADIESQAIKRAHRIGQTKPVIVQTLAIRNTFEEIMVQRRSALKNRGGKLPGIFEETGIRQFLQNPVFLESSTQNIVQLALPLLPLPDPSPEDSHTDEAIGGRKLTIKLPAMNRLSGDRSSLINGEGASETKSWAPPALSSPSPAKKVKRSIRFE